MNLHSVTLFHSQIFSFISEHESIIYLDLSFSYVFTFIYLINLLNFFLENKNKAVFYSTVVFACVVILCLPLEGESNSWSEYIPIPEVSCFLKIVAGFVLGELHTILICNRVLAFNIVCFFIYINSIFY